MATRVYLQNAAADISPSNWATGWGTPVTGNVTRKGSRTKGSTTFATVAAASGNVVATLPFMRFLLGPLKAQSISGSISGQMRGQESNAASQNTHAIGVRLLTSAGAERSVLLAPSYSDLVDNAAYELYTALRNLPFYNINESTTIALTTQSASDGDYLEITIGSRKNAAVTSRTITLEYGDNNATDLTAGDYAQTSQYCPWIEFTANIALRVTATLDGGLTPSADLSKNSAKTMAGGVTPTGDLSKGSARTLPGGVTPTGGLIKQVGYFLAGLFSTSELSATLLPEKQSGGPIERSFDAGITPTGDLSKGNARSFSGDL